MKTSSPNAAMMDLSGKLEDPDREKYVQVVTSVDSRFWVLEGGLQSLHGKPFHVKVCRGKAIDAVRAGISRGTWHDSTKVRYGVLSNYTFLLLLTLYRNQSYSIYFVSKVMPYWIMMSPVCLSPLEEIKSKIQGPMTSSYQTYPRNPKTRQYVRASEDDIAIPRFTVESTRSVGLHF